MTMPLDTPGKQRGRGLRSAPTTVKRVHVLDHGTLSLDRSIMLYGPDLATIDNQNRPAEWLTIPSYSVLVECEDCRILFDTGSHPKSHERWAEALRPLEVLNATEECFLPHRLEQLKLQPSDIDIVVVSHMHMDHSGCLEFLTNARVIVQRNEFRSALENYARTDGSVAYCKPDIRAWIDAGVQWSVVADDEAEFTLVPGVTVHNFGSGHVEGLLGMTLDLPETGRIMLASDICYARVNLGPPPVLPGTTSAFDTLGMIRSARRLSEMEREDGAQIWFGHDPEQYAGMIKAPDGCYE